MQEELTIAETPQPEHKGEILVDAWKNESKEKIVPPTLRPQIHQFPERAQPVIQEVYEKAQSAQSFMNRLLDGSIQVISAAKGKQQDKNEVIRLSTEITPEDKEEQDRLVSTVWQEINLLQKAYVKITHGKDAPELRDVPNPFTGTSYRESHFQEEDIHKYGKPRRISNLVKKVRAMVQWKEYSVGKGTFKETMAQLFRDRYSDLLRLGFRESSSRPNINAPELRVLNEALQLPEAEIGAVMIEALDTYFGEAKKIAQQTAAFTYFLGQCKDIVNSNLGRLNNVNVRLSPMGDELDRVIDITRQETDLGRKMFSSRVEGYDARIKQYLSLVGKIVKTSTYEILINSRPVTNPGTSENVLQSASLSQDYIELASQLKAKIGEVRHLAEEGDVGFSYDFPYSVEAANWMENVIQYGEMQAHEDAELATSTDLLFHVGRLEAIKSVLKRRVLASKKFQIDTFGEANFESAGLGMRVGKDYVVLDHSPSQLISGKMSKETYRRNFPDKKQPDQEIHQICLEENGLYMYYQGVALVFNKGSLFSKSQFIQQDGWHLFDKGYSHDDTDSPGFAVDLTQEPFMVVVKKDLAKEMEDFVRNELAQDAKWEITDADAWIQEHVVIIPNGAFHEFTLEEFEKVKRDFNNKYPFHGSSGWVVPSGEQGETATEFQGRPRAPLFTYQQTA